MGNTFFFSCKVNLALTDNFSGSIETGDKDSVFYDHAVLKLPPAYSETGKPTRLVYMAHGAGGGVMENNWFLEQFSLDDTLLANGYAVYDVNGGEYLENMGGNRVVQSSYKAYEYIRVKYNIYDEIMVIGLSMGGLSDDHGLSVGTPELNHELVLFFEKFNKY